MTLASVLAGIYVRQQQPINVCCGVRGLDSSVHGSTGTSSYRAKPIGEQHRFERYEVAIQIEFRSRPLSGFSPFSLQISSCRPAHSKHSIIQAWAITTLSAL
jgi:hypothetical protein